MKARRWHYHDEQERRKWQDPEAVLAEIGVKPGDTFVDVGCGEGFFTLPAARLVGEQGRVYAIDGGDEAVSHLREKAAAEKLGNIQTVVGAAEDTVVCRGCADFVFFGIVLHDFSDAAKALSNARQMLKPSGALIDIDWKKEAMSLGPPVARRFSEEQARTLIEAGGFQVRLTKDCGAYHYLITASR